MSPGLGGRPASRLCPSASVSHTLCVLLMSTSLSSLPPPALNRSCRRWLSLASRGLAPGQDLGQAYILKQAISSLSISFRDPLIIHLVV